MGAVDNPLVLQRHRITVDDYERLAEAGVLAPDARVELIEGEVIDMAPMKSRHAGVVWRLLRKLAALAGDQALVMGQTPLRLSDSSEPEPDVMLLRWRADEYTQSHPVPADVLLLIEVSDTSLRYDREIKAPLYARHGIAELWIVDLEANCVRFYRQGDGHQYTDITATETPGATALPGLHGAVLDLSSILV